MSSLVAWCCRWWYSDVVGGGVELSVMVWCGVVDGGVALLRMV